MKSKSAGKTKAKPFSPGEKLTIGNIEEIRDNIMGLLSEEKNLKLDLCDVSECDTSGIQVLVSLKKYGKQQGNKISIINETEPVTNEALALGLCIEDLFG